VKRQPTPEELVWLECAKAIDRLEEELRDHSRAIARLERDTSRLLEREDWIEHYRTDEHAYEELRDL
jgi:hypothetical protein